jgi:hypothetical protein
MNKVKITLYFLFLSPFLVLANKIDKVEATPNSPDINTELSLRLNFTTPEDQVQCGITIDWGDGLKEKLRVGSGQQIPPPYKLTHTYTSSGQKQLSIKGEFIARGIKSVPGCDINITGSIIIQDPTLRAEKERVENERRAELQKKEQEQLLAQKPKDRDTEAKSLKENQNNQINPKKNEGLTRIQVMDINELRNFLIQSGFTEEDILSFQYYYSFVWHTRQRINSNIDRKNKKENFEANGLNVMLPYKTEIEKLVEDMDLHLSNIAKTLGVNDQTIFKIFGSEKINNEGYLQLNSDLNRVNNGRIIAGYYWDRHACQKCSSVSKFFDEQDPDILFKNLRFLVDPNEIQKVKIYLSKFKEENKNQTVYGNLELRSILSKNWPHWTGKEIEHAINSEARNILKKQPDLTLVQINQAVTELWIQRIKSKNNPELAPDADTFAKKKGFRGAPFNNIDSSIELVTACVANNVNFLNKSKGTNFETKGVRDWTTCTMQKSINDPKYSINFDKWSNYFKNESPAKLQILGDICMKNITVTYAGGKCYSVDYSY